MFTRKSLFVALTVIAMLAMLVPVAVAAPEVVTGIEITAPTEVDWIVITPPATIEVEYNLIVAGQQVNDVKVTATLYDDYNYVAATAWEMVDSSTLHNGVNPESLDIDVPETVWEGWFNLKLCADDGIDPCTVQRHAVLIDKTAPEVWIERPAPCQECCTWVTGNEYELFGYAEDNFEVERAWFEFSAWGNRDDAIVIGNEDANFEGQDAEAVAGFPGEFTATWDSSLVPDGVGYIHFCAEDIAGLESCTPWVRVCIENRVKIDLAKGWNLISTPLLLYENGIDDVLSNLWNSWTGEQWADTPSPIDMVYTTRDGGATWSFWADGAPDGLTEIEDGYGYWVHTVAPVTIEFIGTWLSIGPVAPPEYAVHEGWNLIGYTHWGQPTMGPWEEVNKTVSDYLGWPMVVSVESMYRYNAFAGHYVPVDEMSGEKYMRQGAGYWLALAEGTEGTINP